MKKIQKSIHPDDNLHYLKLGLNKDKVEICKNIAFDNVLD